MRRLVTLLVLLTSTVLAGGCAAPTTLSADLPATLRLGSAGGHMTVQGEVNGTTLTFVVDTGSSFCVLTGDAARRVGLTAGGWKRYRIQDISGGAKDYHAARVDELRLPTEPGGDDAATRPATPVVVRGLDFVVVERPAYAVGYDGILGQSFLDLGIFAFDAKQREMRIIDGELIAEDSLPLKMNHGELQVELTDSGRAIPANVDTGNYGTLGMTEAAAEAVGLASPVKVVGLSAGLHSRFESRAVRLARDLNLGPILLKKPVISLLPGNGVGANLGNELLRHYEWAIDVRTRRLQFYGDTPYYAWRAVTTAGFAYEGEKNVVTWVLAEGSAAAAGLRVGDEIVSINGLAVSSTSPVRSAPNGFDIVARRDGGTVEMHAAWTRRRGRVPGASAGGRVGASRGGPQRLARPPRSVAFFDLTKWGPATSASSSRPARTTRPSAATTSPTPTFSSPAARAAASTTSSAASGTSRTG